MIPSKEKESVVLRIAGAAGDGIASSGEVFGKICSRLGLHVMAYNAYQSAIRGGHVWLQLHVGSEKTLSHGEAPDVLVLLNRTSPEVHVPQVKKGSVVFYNTSQIPSDFTKMRQDVTFYGIPFRELVTEPGVEAVMANTMLLGGVVGILGLDPKIGLDFIADRFRKKGEQVIGLNQRVFQIGMDWVKKNAAPLNVSLHGDGKKRMFLTGNHAFGMGLLAGGLKFYAGYPMSPSSGILHYVAAKAKAHQMIVKQTEDEIAAVNFIIGAAHAGVRTATATSGGGFSLMVEGVGLAGMLEEPIVIINVQRGGPSTGIPTKQEQGDLNLLLGAGQGDFPRIILAPKDTEDAFYTAWRALNLAEKYQTPVLILSDLFLSEHFQTVDPFRFDLPIERGKLLRSVKGEYKRFLITEDGISPRLLPGATQGMYCSASDEHDESGIVISDVLAGLPSSLEIRNKIHAKRMRKLDVMRNEDMRLPTLTGEPEAELTLMGWGSTYDAIEEACQYFAHEGIAVNHLHFTDIYPLPIQGVLDILNSCHEIIGVETNYTSQMCRLIRTETGYHVKKTVNRYDGEPFTGEDIYRRVKKEIMYV
ncbi:MAG: 2-oxoacid:acceptor oxidoreductase subunit alpha [Candidatus Omnitrophica bacterium]|nr:2-oxoacid:acceptor oxidoreductase subunit alpha [Candidatus Omnitrophota bacterium]